MSLYSDNKYQNIGQVAGVTVSRAVKPANKSEILQQFHPETPTYIKHMEYPCIPADSKLPFGKIVIRSYCQLSGGVDSTELYNIFTDTLTIKPIIGDVDTNSADEIANNLLEFICQYINFNESRLIPPMYSECMQNKDVYATTNLAELIIAGLFCKIQIPALLSSEISLIISKLREAEKCLDEVTKKFNDDCDRLEEMRDTGIINHEIYLESFQLLSDDYNKLSSGYCELIRGLFADNRE